MDPVLDVFLPGLTFLTMAVVGLDLTVADFRRVVSAPRLVIGATLGQMVLLPAATLVLASALDPPEVVVGGMVVIAACPGGALSNLFTYVARANVALSVTLTALSSLLSTVTLPLLVNAQFALLRAGRAEVEVPTLRMVVQLAAFLLLPVALGMAVRAHRSHLADRHRNGLQNFSVGAGLLLVGVIVFAQREALVALAGPTLAMAFAYTVAALTSGALTGILLSSVGGDRLTLVIEFSCRNLPIATLVGATLLQRADFVVFAAGFFLVQTAMASALVAAWRARS